MQLFVLRERTFEGCGHGITFEERDPADKIVAFGLFGWEFGKIDLDGEVISLFWGDNVWTVFSLEDVLSAVLEEFVKAFYGDGDEDFRFCFGGGDVEGDAIEIGDDLVNGGG